jgi:hypothetical protein
MAYLFALVIAGLVAFLGLLLRFDLSPRIAMNRILRRFTNAPDLARASLSDAPYRQIKGVTTRLLKPLLLNIQTSDGSGQAAHPDVVYVPEGFGPQKWPYWMVCTPYPYGNDFFENPEVFASFDGINWEVPDGAKNPLVAPLSLKGDHHSDPDVVLHENQFWLFYRQTLRSRTPTENRIYLMKSTDGSEWGRPVEALLDKNGTGLLSPAVIHDGNSFRLWMIERLEEKFVITLRLSEDGTNWSTARKCEVIGALRARNLWHIDVIQEQDRLSALIVTCTGQVGEGSRIHYGHSFDQGETWHVGPFLFDQIYEFEASLQYRATLRKMQDDPAVYEVWYSAANSKYMWSIAYLRCVREGNNLRPDYSGRRFA